VQILTVREAANPWVPLFTGRSQAVFMSMLTGTPLADLLGVGFTGLDVDGGWEAGSLSKLPQLENTKSEERQLA
jgi:hypothetical protein